ncbi:MAG: hypothetical protein QW255_05610 [Candidatus Bilamarchaeaceae archaeon]
MYQVQPVNEIKQLRRKTYSTGRKSMVEKMPPKLKDKFIKIVQTLKNILSNISNALSSEEYKANVVVDFSPGYSYATIDTRNLNGLKTRKKESSEKELIYIVNIDGDYLKYFFSHVTDGNILETEMNKTAYLLRTFGPDIINAHNYKVGTANMFAGIVVHELTHMANMHVSIRDPKYRQEVYTNPKFMPKESTSSASISDPTAAKVIKGRGIKPLLMESYGSSDLYIRSIAEIEAEASGTFFSAVLSATQLSIINNVKHVITNGLKEYINFKNKYFNKKPSEKLLPYEQVLESISNLRNKLLSDVEKPIVLKAILSTDESTNNENDNPNIDANNVSSEDIQKTIQDFSNLHDIIKTLSKSLLEDILLSEGAFERIKSKSYEQYKNIMGSVFGIREHRFGWFNLYSMLSSYEFFEGLVLLPTIGEFTREIVYHSIHFALSDENASQAPHDVFTDIITRATKFYIEKISNDLNVGLLYIKRYYEIHEINFKTMNKALNHYKSFIANLIKVLAGDNTEAENINDDYKEKLDKIIESIYNQANYILSSIDASLEHTYVKIMFSNILKIAKEYKNKNTNKNSQVSKDEESKSVIISFLDKVLDEFLKPLRYFDKSLANVVESFIKGYVTGDKPEKLLNNPIYLQQNFEKFYILGLDDFMKIRDTDYKSYLMSIGETFYKESPYFGYLGSKILVMFIMMKMIYDTIYEMIHQIRSELKKDLETISRDKIENPLSSEFSLPDIVNSYSNKNSSSFINRLSNFLSGTKRENERYRTEFDKRSRFIFLANPTDLDLIMIALHAEYQICTYLIGGFSA